MDHEWAKFIAGTAGAFVGGVMAAVGLVRRVRASRRFVSIFGGGEPLEREDCGGLSEPRRIERREWHEMRDFVNRLSFRVEAMERTLGDLRGECEEDRLQLALLREQMRRGK
jgi:hypothetical protein